MNDVFISYAHLDDQALSEGQRGWISQFHRILEVRLGQLLGEAPRIWRDPKLKGSDLFDDALVREFTDSKVLVSVLTPRYVKSEWCIRELEEFNRSAAAKEGNEFSDKGRIFKIVKTPVPPEELPANLVQIFSRILGFEFFDIDSETGRIREYDESFGSEAKQRFFERVYDVAHEISQLLRSLNQDPSKAKREPAEGKIVYLAETTADLQSQRNTLKRELQDRGHTVLPDYSLPVTRLELEEAVRGMIEKSHLAIHLVGSRFGFIPEEADQSVVVIQNQLAAECSVGKGLQRFIWMPAQLQPKDERQSAFLKTLETDSRTIAGAEILQDSLVELRRMVIDRLSPQRIEVESKPRTAKEGPATVYLICDQRDEEAIEGIEDFFFDQGMEVVTSSFEGDESEVTQTHRRSLQACDGVLIYYGAGSKSWVEMKLMDLLQAPGYGRDKPFKSQLVYVAPPVDRRKERFRTHRAEIVCQPGESFEALETLKTFAEKLRQP